MCLRLRREFNAYRHAMTSEPTLGKKLSAEFLGTFVLVFGGCGAAVLAGGEIGFLGVALAFGLTVVAMAYAVGHISGGHFNPAVTLGAASAGRLPWRDAGPYIATQIVGGLAGGAVLLLIANGQAGFDPKNNFAANGYGEFSPGGYSLLAALVIEFLLTAVFLWVILGVTDQRAPKGFAPLAIGLSLTLIHLIAIPVTNTSVNPARSIGVAFEAGGDAVSQLWLFILAPIAGAIVAGLSYASLLDDPAASGDLADAMEG